MLLTFEQVRNEINLRIAEHALPLREDDRLQGKIDNQKTIIGLEYVLVNTDGVELRAKGRKVRVWIEHEGRKPYRAETHVSSMRVAIGKGKRTPEIDAAFRRIFGVDLDGLWNELGAAGFAPEPPQEYSIVCLANDRPVEFLEWIARRWKNYAANL